jgi:hypothetical protein
MVSVEWNRNVRDLYILCARTEFKSPFRDVIISFSERNFKFLHRTRHATMLYKKLCALCEVVKLLLKSSKFSESLWTNIHLDCIKF